MFIARFRWIAGKPVDIRIKFFRGPIAGESGQLHRGGKPVYRPDIAEEWAQLGLQKLMKIRAPIKISVFQLVLDENFAPLVGGYILVSLFPNGIEIGNLLPLRHYLSV